MPASPDPPSVVTVCPVCQARREPDGVCLACLLSEAITAPDMDSAGGSTLGDIRAFTTLGRLELPCSLAGYRLLREIASGGMGIVYEAEDDRLKRRVALKMLRAAAFARPDELARFRVEAELAAQLDHPNIVPIYEVGDVDGMPFFTMRLIDGMSLADKLQQANGPLKAREAATLMMKVARAVQHAHQRGVLHRDLKPANILIDGHGEPHLTDFGLAKLLDDSTQLTRSSAHLGTPHYMSPEQAAGRTREVTTASDVWALGVLLYQMLTLKLPYDGEGAAAVMLSIQVARPVPLTGLNPDLATLVQRCLEKEPSKRPASAGFLAEELERWLQGVPILSRRVGAGERIWRWAWRHRLLAVVLAVAGLLFMLGSGAASWHRSQSLGSMGGIRTQLKEAEKLTDLLLETLKTFAGKSSGPAPTQAALNEDFLMKMKAFEGSPQRQIQLFLKLAAVYGHHGHHTAYAQALRAAIGALPADDPLLWELRLHSSATAPDPPSLEKAQVRIRQWRVIHVWHLDHLGPDHPLTIRSQFFLARQLTPWGGHAEALRLLEEVKAAMQQHPENPPVTWIAFEGACMDALSRNARVEEALALGRESCARWLKTVDVKTSHDLALNFNHLAVICTEAGLQDEAFRHARQSADILWQFDEPASHAALASLATLLEIQRRHGGPQAVLATHHDALRAFDIAYGPSHFETQRRVASFADDLVKAGRKAEAAALFVQWLDRLRGSDGKLAQQAAELERSYAEHLKATQ